MMNMKRMGMSALMAGCIVAGACAQSLSKEITVDKDYVPVERKATKSNAMPVVTESSKQMTKLDYSDWAVPTQVKPTIPVMKPYGYQTDKEFSDARGYFDLGMGTQLNIVGSAGYRVLDSEANQLSVWAHHNSTWLGDNATTNRYLGPDGTRKQKFCDNWLGANFTSDFSEGTLNLWGRGHLDMFNYYGAPDGDFYDVKNQTFSQILVGGKWQSRTAPDEFSYSAALTFSHSGYNKGLQPLLTRGGTDYDYVRDWTKGLSENHLNLVLNGAYQMGDNYHIGLDFGVQYLGYNDYSVWSVDKPAGDPVVNGSPILGTCSYADKSLGMITTSPYFLYTKEKLRIRLGANVNFSMSDGTVMRFAPNCMVDYSITNTFGIYLAATGGKRLVTIADMAELCRYACPVQTFGNEYVPIDAEVGALFGPAGGFHIRFFAGYGSTKGASMPFVYVNDRDWTRQPYQLNAMQSVLFATGDTKGFKAGVDAGYKFRSLVDANVKFTYAPQSYDSKATDENGHEFEIGGGNGYSLGLDRAKAVLEASVKVNPIEKLSVTLGYELRAGRRVQADSWTTDFRAMRLNNVNNLTLGASYQVTPKLTIFAQGNNLLNRKWDLFYGLGAQKLGFMAGFGVVF